MLVLLTYAQNYASTIHQSLGVNNNRKRPPPQKVVVIAKDRSPNEDLSGKILCVVDGSSLTDLD